MLKVCGEKELHLGLGSSFKTNHSQKKKKKKTWLKTHMVKVLFIHLLKANLTSGF
jgi:hypothetical protein